MEKTNELTEKQVKEYCRKRDLMIVSTDMVHRLQLVGQKFATNQLTMETKTVLEAKNEKLTCRNIILSANVQNLEAENGSLRFRYANMKKLLNQFIATGLIPGYFDIYHQLCETKFKLKAARKEAAKANKKYKQLKKEFSRYRNEHTESDCNPYLAKIRDLEQQIEAMKEHRERMNEFVCYNCDHAFRGIASDGTDELYCRASGEDPVCVSEVKVCPGFKQKKGDKPNE